MGQMVHDVRYAAAGSRNVDFYGMAGGLVPSPRSGGRSNPREGKRHGRTD